ncbi:MAG: hypothetical protein IID18_05740, partial [Nitrospinae bacterium]|nr:hypothetical protein [Nitrospinota bacterium]
MKPLSRSRTFAFAFAAQALALLVIFGVAESVFRLMNPDYGLRGTNERNFFCKFDPVLGWSPKENFTGI